MADPNLTESAWQRAKVDAAGVYQSTAFQIGGALVTAIFSALALIAQEGQPTTTQVAVPILAAAVAILLSVVVVFACQLAAAPVRQRNELRATWEQPEIKTVNVGLSLQDLHRKGTELLHRFSVMQYGIGRPELEETAEWADSVVAFLSEHAPEELTKRFIAAGQDVSAPLTRLEIRLGALQGILDELG